MKPPTGENEQIPEKIAAKVADSAGKLSAFTFITPLFGVVASYVIMHDTLTGYSAPGDPGLYLVNRPSPAVPAAIDPLLNVTKT